MICADMQVVVFGGHAYLGDGKFEYLNDTWVLDVSSLVWQKVYCGGTPPSERYGHSCVVVGSRMFVFGGRGAGGVLLRDMHFLDLVEWTWVPVSATSSGPCPRFNHAALVVGRKIVIHGGWNGGTTCYGDMHVFDTETFTWVEPKTGGLKPPPLYGHTLNLAANGHILSIGGVSIGDGNKSNSKDSVLSATPVYHNDFRSLDTETMIWSRPRLTGHYPTARYSHTVTSINNNYVLFGGWGNGGMQSKDEGNKTANVASMVVLDSSTMEWKVPECLNPSPLMHLYGHQAVEVSGHYFVFGGWNGKQATNTLFICEIGQVEEQEGEQEGE
jgi:host cell factor